MDAAVSSVSVAAASCNESPATSWRCRKCAPNRSRPVVLGFGMAKYSSANIASSRAFVNAARRGELAVTIALGGTAGSFAHERVEQHVAGARVEGDRRVGLATGGQQRRVGDAADIERNAILVVAAEQQRVNARDQRRALTARRTIGAAEIVTDRRVEALADDERIAQLQRRMRGTVVPNGLAVRGNEADALAGSNRARRRGIGTTELVVQPCNGSHAAVVGRKRRQQRGVQVWFERMLLEAQQLDVIAIAGGPNADECRVDAVERRAAH